MSSTNKTLEELLEIIRAAGERDFCVGNCDIEPPYKECSECVARGALNYVYVILQHAYEEIEMNKAKDQKGMN
jgi:hypothetical protein